jgi:hypothetical protein
MPIWVQNLLVLLAVVACVAFIGRQAIAALHGRKSKLAGCGSCKSCGPAESSEKETDPKLQIVPLELLKRRS